MHPPSWQAHAETGKRSDNLPPTCGLAAIACVRGTLCAAVQLVCAGHLCRRVYPATLRTSRQGHALLPHVSRRGRLTAMRQQQGVSLPIHAAGSEPRACMCTRRHVLARMCGRPGAWQHDACRGALLSGPKRRAAKRAATLHARARRAPRRGCDPVPAWGCVCVLRLAVPTTYYKSLASCKGLPPSWHAGQPWPAVAAPVLYSCMTVGTLWMCIASGPDTCVRHHHLRAWPSMHLRQAPHCLLKSLGRTAMAAAQCGTTPGNSNL